MNGAVTMGSNEYNTGNNNNSEASPVREEYRKDAESSPPPVKISKRDKERERDRERRERRERDRDREERERGKVQYHKHNRALFSPNHTKNEL
uniref:Uncharacterized protein n=1 Tax=Anopheles stephensi TaxID=30069 RepID=A0A182YA23_ANOST